MEFNEGYIKDLTEVAERSKSNSHRLDAVESDIKSLKNDNKALYELTASIKILSGGIETVKEDIKEVRSEQTEMKDEIKEIKNAPYKTKAGWFDGATKLVVTALGTGIVAFLLGNCLPTIFHP